MNEPLGTTTIVRRNADTKSPMRKILNVWQTEGGYMEALECGHEVFVKEEWKPTKKRRCKECAHEAGVLDNG